MKKSCPGHLRVLGSKSLVLHIQNNKTEAYYSSLQPTPVFRGKNENKWGTQKATHRLNILNLKSITFWVLTWCSEGLNFRQFWIRDYSDWVCVVWLFTETHRCLFTPGREGIDSQNTTLKINFMGFVTGAERTHSHLYYGEFPWLLTGSYTTSKSCPNSFFTVKGRFLVVSPRALIVSQDNPFRDSCSYSTVWRDLESTWEIYSSGSLWGPFQRVLTERRRPFLKGDAQIPGAPRTALWLAVRVYYHGHPPPI